jgi:hypothetical protein
VLLTVVVFPFVIFSGFLIRPEDVPPYFIWMIYISFVKWAFQAAAILIVSLKSIHPPYFYSFLAKYFVLQQDLIVLIQLEMLY